MLAVLVAGARPNFIKIAPIVKQLDINDIQYLIVHTGQHYDYNMSKIFFQQLSLPEPDYYLGVGSGTHTYQTAKAMLGIEKILLRAKPNITIVVGDVNSTLAGALAAAKSGVPVAHVEAGLRSYDHSMPEEINRLLTDTISDLLFTTCEDANINLRIAGITESKIHFVGNVMIDTLVALMEQVERSTILEEINIHNQDYVYITLHRPTNVDNPLVLEEIAKALQEVSKMGLKMIFPMHPRTRENLERFNLISDFQRIEGMIISEPVGYVDSIALVRSAKLVLTDSGGLQEETTFLEIPCLTLRPNTERPVTIKKGTNILLDKGPSMIPPEVEKILRGHIKKGEVPELWDGKSAERIVEIISQQPLYIQA